MTRRKKIISVLVALIVILSALFVFPLTLTANAASVTMGSGLFTNTKNMTIKGTDDGVALRVDQKEYAYAEWATALPMNGFSMDFKIIDDNFEKLVLTFTSMYDEKDSDDFNIVNSMPESNPEERAAKEKAKRDLIQPEKKKDVITLTKESNGVGVAINPINTTDKTTIGSGWKDFEFTVSYDGNDFIVKDKNNSGQKTVAVGSIINNEANLRIDFPKDSIKKIRKDVKNKDDSSKIDTYGESTLLITNVSYKNTNSNETQNQSLKGATVEDTSKPVLKVDGRVLNKDNNVNNNKTEVFVPVATQYKIPVYGVDAVKSSSTLSLSATVKYYKNDTDESPETVTVSSMAFQVEKTEGYYLIEKITIKDGTHTVDFENKDGSIKNIGDNLDIPMPITVKGVARTDPDTEPAKTFAFNITEDYAKLFKGIELKGGKNKIVFPMPMVMDDVSASTGVRSYVGNEKENPYYIQYKLWYQYGTDNPDTWTENKTVNSNGFGLEFIASKVGVYNFWIEAIDRPGNSLSSIYYVDPLDGQTKIDTSKIITLEFADTEIPEMTVSNFPDEVIVNQKFTIPTASIADDFNTSPKKTIELYYLNEDGTKGDRIDLATDNSFTPDDKMLDKEFIVVYNATEGYVYDAVENDLVEKKAITIERTFKVVEAPPPVGPGFEWNALSIVFLSLGGASLLGIIAILLIKPKEKVN